jgi:hypothetical protein
MGLLRCYISRVENRQTVPAIETLEKLARAIESHSINSSTVARNARSFPTFSKGSLEMVSELFAGDQ